MTRRRLWWPSTAWWFPTVGPDNDRVVPWLAPARSLPVALVFYAVVFAVLYHVRIADDAAEAWALAPYIAGWAVVVGLCGRRKHGSKIHHRTLAVITFFVVWAALSFAGVRVFPAAGRAHAGPVRGLVFLIATLVALFLFVAVTHWRLHGPRHPAIFGASSSAAAESRTVRSEGFDD